MCTNSVYTASVGITYIKTLRSTYEHDRISTIKYKL